MSKKKIMHWPFYLAGLVIFGFAVGLFTLHEPKGDRNQDQILFEMKKVFDLQQDGHHLLVPRNHKKSKEEIALFSDLEDTRGLQVEHTKGDDRVILEIKDVVKDLKLKIYITERDGEYNSILLTRHDSQAFTYETLFFYRGEVLYNNELTKETYCSGKDGEASATYLLHMFRDDHDEVLGNINVAYDKDLSWFHNKFNQMTTSMWLNKTFRKR